MGFQDYPMCQTRASERQATDSREGADGTPISIGKPYDPEPGRLKYSAPTVFRQ